MRPRIMVFGSISLVPGLIFMLLSRDISPEDKMLGRWKEVSWAYEKIDKSKHAGSSWMEEIDDHVQKEMYDHLVVHQAEEWEFFPEGDLTLHSAEGNSIRLDWKLKGRGNVLQLEHASHEVEHYTVQELTSEKLILHFNTDLQVRGIVKMTFERID